MRRLLRADRARRGDHAGRVHAGESRDPRPVARRRLRRRAAAPAGPQGGGQEIRRPREAPPRKPARRKKAAGREIRGRPTHRVLRKPALQRSAPSPPRAKPSLGPRAPPPAPTNVRQACAGSRPRDREIRRARLDRSRGSATKKHATSAITGATAKPNGPSQARLPLRRLPARPRQNPGETSGKTRNKAD